MTVRELLSELEAHHMGAGVSIELRRPRRSPSWRIELVQDDTGIVIVPALESPYIEQLLSGTLYQLRRKRGMQ